MLLLGSLLHPEPHKVPLFRAAGTGTDLVHDVEHEGVDEELPSPPAPETPALLPFFLSDIPYC